jgi:hypothetical protein
MPRRRRVWLALAAILAGGSSSLCAQHATRPALAISHAETPPARPSAFVQPRAPTPSRAPVWAVAASALLPGAGQAILGVDRFVPYSAFEIYQWSQYGAHARTSRRQRDEYRSLAALVARAPFTKIFPVGSFDYYERLEHWEESGVFEVTKGGVLDPEPDTTTFNGSMWLLARRTYWRDIDTPPDTSTLEWKLAADFYRRRAYDAPYRWSWRNAQLQYDEYRRFIHRSNESNRKALQDLGTILANHVLSTIDAYVTVRVRRRPDSPAGGYEVNATLPLSLIPRH